MNKPTKIYAEVLESAALEQFNSAMEQDFAIKGALMPDAHLGYCLPIGAVVATKDMIVPAWVGYDIGCGMCAIMIDTPLCLIQKYATEIFDQIYKDIPVGFKSHNRDNHDECQLTVAALANQLTLDETSIPKPSELCYIAD